MRTLAARLPGVLPVRFGTCTSIEELAGREFVTANLDLESLYCWRIPAPAKPGMIRELSGLGITQRAVFPDLDGVARSLWETEVLWSKKVEDFA